jgi:hypothetical protein
MALDLNLIITADASQAKRALSDVELGIKKVEGAARSTADPIAKTTDAVAKLATGQNTLADTGDRLKDVALGDAKALEAATLAMIRGDAAALSAAKSTETLTVATTASQTALIGAKGALLGVGVAYAGFALIVRNGILEYARHTGELDNTSRAVGRLGAAWNKFELEVGRRLVGGGGRHRARVSAGVRPGVRHGHVRG